MILEWGNGGMEWVHFSRCAESLRELLPEVATRPSLPGSAGTPAARTFHAGDFAGLLHITVGKQLEHGVARF